MSTPARRVLVLDDDAAAAGEVLRILARASRPRIEAVRGRASGAAFDALYGSRFDIVLLGLSGSLDDALGLLDEVLGRAAGVPVIAVYATDNERYGERLVAGGARQWIARAALSAGVLMRSIRGVLDVPSDSGAASGGARVAHLTPATASRPSPAPFDEASFALPRVPFAVALPSHVAPEALPPWASPPADAPPELFDGKYRLLRRVAQGGVGQIFEARHELIGSRLAIKMLRNELSHDPEMAARFLQEARAAGAVGHPGCVKVFDFGTAPDGRAYLVMEYLEGESLHTRILRERRLPVGEAVSIVGDTLDVLAATHEAGILHRDLKSENIFLAQGPRNTRTVKLLDFGTARLIDGGAPDDRLTHPGSVIGTPCFMAPEQAIGSPDVDARADVYSAGVVLFEALTGRVPFEGRTFREVLSKVLTEPFPTLRSIDPALSGILDDILRHATARDPARRFGSAAEFRDALRLFAG